MMRQALRKGSFVFIICLLILGAFLIHSSVTRAQPLTYTVEKGDTLWSICEKFYGNADLWPKLWQMNPFITNPHFLNPGDTITLIEKGALKKTAPQVKKPVVTESPQAAPPVTGLDVSSFMNIETIGFLSPERTFKPLGRIVSTDSPRVILDKGDSISVVIKELKVVKPGDEFDIARSSLLLDHPLTKKTLGHVVTVSGRVVIENVVGNSIYEARVTKAFRPMYIGDLVIPYVPLTPCVEPSPVSEEVMGCIAASKNEATVLGRFSIVYLDIGLNHGVRRGNLFNVVKKRSLLDPNIKGETVDEYIHRKQVPLPEKAIGSLLVLKSYPKTSTGVVLTTDEVYYVGAKVKGASWDHRPAALSRVRECVAGQVSR